MRTPEDTPIVQASASLLGGVPSEKKRVFARPAGGLDHAVQRDMFDDPDLSHGFYAKLTKEVARHNYARVERGK
jgi:hypothetical protein